MYNLLRLIGKAGVWWKLKSLPEYTEAEIFGSQCSNHCSFMQNTNWTVCILAGMQRRERKPYNSRHWIDNFRIIA